MSLLGRWVTAWPAIWAWPLILSLVFAGGVLFWLRAMERQDLDAQRAEMIADALTLESQISGRLDAETARLKILADAMGEAIITPRSFAREAMVLDGLRRFWVDVTWLDDAGQIQAQAPLEDTARRDAVRSSGDDGGLSGHLMVPVSSKDGVTKGSLIARYSAAAILRQKLPWWLASKYDIRLVDVAGDVIASTVDKERAPNQAWYRVSMGATMPNAWLEVTARTVIGPWWRSLPVALMGVFVVLVVLATLMLRRQMRSVSLAEEAWRTEAAWRQAMEDSLAIGIRARDLDGRLVYVNKALADMVGYSPDELVGKLPPMPYWLPDQIEQTMSQHLRNMAGQAPREGYESKWCHRDGHAVDVMVYEAPLVDSSGEQIGWMASIVNITERKQMEERERRQMESMAHNARLTMLGEVASTLAHELNQPLSVIMSYNTGLLNALERAQPPQSQLIQPLQRMAEQAAHAGRIVKRIREFLTRREPELERSDLRRILFDGMALLQRELLKQDVEWSAHLAPDLEPVRADPVLVEQVLINLVRNACDAMSGRSGPRRLLITASRIPQQGFVKVMVSDSGPGLGGKTIDQLCAAFFSTKPDGMGMGLAICRSIIELHHGVLDVEESPLGGAAFVFSLPVWEASE
ncbi:PAS domain S-box protein [Aquabacterium sp.]|uniref:sensor histidine kinase n=1 Tax=Aquabacterium sp. TaxID=1872578 RepID=UPI002E3785E8|nr:PAS domain S-box protein [Aquabacterium sp.]HEX5312555.1 PAS domain S-box protein [Aquabacterium sp.]